YDVPRRETPHDLLEVGKVRRWIKEFGDDTNRLLCFVYGNTEPMHDAFDGDVLDFSKAQPCDVRQLQGRPPTQRQEKRFADAMKRLRVEYETARAENANIQDGPRDAAYYDGLPQEDVPMNGIIELAFDNGR